MKTALFFYLALFLISGESRGLLAQTPSQNPNDAFKLREEMHRRMMDKLLHGVGPDQDLFKDMEEYMNEVMKNSFSGFDAFDQLEGPKIKTAWSEEKEGRKLTITPNNPEDKLDINVTDGVVVIQGSTEKKSNQGVSRSEFSQSLSVPGDCDSSKVKMNQVNGNIEMFFPFRGAQKVIKKSQEQRVPLPPSDSDIEI